MALAADRFSLLVREIFDVFGSVRDAFAIIGTLYTSRKVLQVTYKFYKALRVYGLPRLANPNIVKQYGKWACKFRVQSVV